MFSYVTGVVAQICAANDRERLLSAIQSGLADLNFVSFNLSCNKRFKRQFMTEPTLTTWSDSDLKNYVSKQWYEHDPLLDYAASTGDAKIWTPDDWKQSPEFGDYADFLEYTGIQSVVTVPLTSGPSTVSAITAIAMEAADVSQDTANAVGIIGQIAMMRAELLGLIETSNVAPDNAVVTALSEHQMEILNWAQQGKTNGEIAVITGRSKRTVAYHISETLKKLGVSTRAQAIALYAGQ